MNSSTSSSDDAGRFLGWAAATLVAALTLAAIVNAVVDPYRVFGLIGVAGFNAHKPRAMERGYLSKLAGVNRLRPHRVIVGNSRAEVGLDPASPASGDALVNYNAAQPGTGPDTALAFLRDAQAQGTLEQGIIGVDFVDFLVGASPSDAPSGESVPMVADPRAHSSGPPRLDLATRLSLLFSLDALRDSAWTVAAQHSDSTPDITALGFNPMRDYAAMAKRDGYGAFFLQRDRENAASYLRAPKSIFEPGMQSSPEWRAIDEMAALCRQLERGCTFVIYPYHAHILELFRLTGLSDLFGEWKAELTRRLLVAAARADASVPDPKLTLWDFSGYNRYSCETVPAVGDRSHVVRWYWEAGHFKRELGDVMIARMTGRGGADFGTRIPIEPGSADPVRLSRVAEDRCPGGYTDTERLGAIVAELRN